MGIGQGLLPVGSDAFVKRHALEVPCEGGTERLVWSHAHMPEKQAIVLNCDQGSSEG